MTEYNLPRASGEAIREAITGYYRSSDGDEPLSREDAAGESEVSSDVIRRQNTFLEDLGILYREDGELYLTEEGREIGRALVHNRDSEAKATLRGLLIEWGPTADIIDELDSTQKTDEELRDDIAYLSETEPDSSRKRAGMNGLIDLYDWSGILISDDGEHYELTDQVQTQDQETSEEEQISDTNTASEQEPEESPTGTEQPIGDQPASVSQSDGNVLVQLDVSADDDPEKIKKLIKNIRAGFQEDPDSES